MAPREILKETNETLKENKEILKDIYEFFTTSSSKLPQTYEHLNKATKKQGTHQKRTRWNTHNSGNVPSSLSHRAQGRNIPFRGTPHFDMACGNLLGLPPGGRCCPSWPPLGATLGPQTPPKEPQSLNFNVILAPLSHMFRSCRPTGSQASSESPKSTEHVSKNCLQRLWNRPQITKSSWLTLVVFKSALLFCSTFLSDPLGYDVIRRRSSKSIYI